MPDRRLARISHGSDKVIVRSQALHIAARARAPVPAMPPSQPRSSDGSPKPARHPEPSAPMGARTPPRFLRRMGESALQVGATAQKLPAQFEFLWYKLVARERENAPCGSRFASPSKLQRSSYENRFPPSLSTPRILSRNRAWIFRRRVWHSRPDAPVSMARIAANLGDFPANGHLCASGL